MSFEGAFSDFSEPDFSDPEEDYIQFFVLELNDNTKHLVICEHSTDFPSDSIVKDLFSIENDAFKSNKFVLNQTFYIHQN